MRDKDVLAVLSILGLTAGALLLLRKRAFCMETCFAPTEFYPTYLPEGYTIKTEEYPTYSIVLTTAEEVSGLLPEEYRAIEKWVPYINEIAPKYGFSPALIASIIYHESKGNPNLVSRYGAIGLMQVLPSTAKKLCGLSKKELFDPYKNIDCGTKYLRYLYDNYGRNISYAIAKYYGGPKATPYSTWGRPPVYAYVGSVLSIFGKLKDIFEKLFSISRACVACPISV